MAAGIANAIDCDIHLAAPDMGQLLPHLDDYWRDMVVTRGTDGLDPTSYPPDAPMSARDDWRPALGKPGGDLALTRADLLDRYGLRFAIANCLHGAPAILNPDLGAALCRAVNDWVAREWLDREPRLRASIVVSMRDVDHAVDEIERLSGDPRFVQVLLPVMGEMGLGRRYYWPVYRAAERHGLAVCVHAGSLYQQPTTAAGWPVHHAEEYAGQAAAFQNQLMSLLTEGVFAKFPDLRVVLAESGVTWLPNFLWRASKTWRGLRTEVPWVDRSPSEVIRRQVRLTLQPFDAPPSAADVQRVMEQAGSDELLLFSTDYPHWRFDGDDVLPDGLSPELARKISINNPLSTYSRLKELVR
jgi:predicted TIM-barrel fold metal-dependent hydrolase